jgi:hypothetical protein
MEVPSRILCRGPRLPHPKEVLSDSSQWPEQWQSAAFDLQTAGSHPNHSLCHSPDGLTCTFKVICEHWGAIYQLLNIILQLRILVLLLVSTLPYVVKVKNYS